jgi:hypothetical protein
MRTSVQQEKCLNFLTLCVQNNVYHEGILAPV